MRRLVDSHSLRHENTWLRSGKWGIHFYQPQPLFLDNVYLFISLLTLWQIVILFYIIQELNFTNFNDLIILRHNYSLNPKSLNCFDTEFSIVLYQIWKYLLLISDFDQNTNRIMISKFIFLLLILSFFNTWILLQDLGRQFRTLIGDSCLLISFNSLPHNSIEALFKIH